MSQQTVIFVPVGYALTLTAISAGSYFIPGDPGTEPSGYAALSASSTTVLGPFNTPRSYSLQSDNNDLTYSLAFSGIYSAADEVISNQAAMDLKANLAGPTFTGIVGLPSTTSIGTVSAAEIGYLDGVGSAIQTQITNNLATTNLKAPIADPTFTGTVALPVITVVKATGTEAANAVTVNGSSGVITTSALTTAAGGTYAITLTNSAIASSSVILLSNQGGTNTILATAIVAVPDVGSATITIKNVDLINALNGTIIYGFLVV